MALLDKLQKVTQDVVRGTKDLTDTARLNSLIADENRQIAALHAQIGKLYLETSDADPETPIGKLCLAIKASNARIAKYSEEIQQIKGARRCPHCGADIPHSSAFCGVCGSKADAGAEAAPSAGQASRVCAGCGAELAEGAAFCTACGYRQ
ncbi:MAG: zinc-ribbon domain-containing protein [Clostridiales bacterium]|jgi:ribosomal protein L40E|nr:zinc-ribbon domain-containing protein [Clostridiales bacterium]